MADFAVNSILLKYELTRKLAQMPVISIPCNLGVQNGRCICLRPFITNDFMTGVAAEPGKDIPGLGISMPFHALEEMVNQISKVENIVKVLYDLTSKPPGTTEWE